MKSKLSFDEFKLNSDGMIPVITQDYKTNEVLMLAYMPSGTLDKGRYFRTLPVCEVFRH